MIISPLFSNFQVTEVQTVNVLTAHTRAVSQLALHADRKSVAVCGVSASNYGCQLWHFHAPAHTHSKYEGTAKPLHNGKPQIHGLYRSPRSASSGMHLHFISALTEDTFHIFPVLPINIFFLKSCIKMLIGKHANLKLSKALPLSLFSLPRFHAAFGHFLTTSSNSRDVFERFRAFLNCSETRGGDIWHKETPFFHHRSKTKMTHNQTLSSYLPLSSSLRGTVVTGEEIQHESNEQI